MAMDSLIGQLFDAAPQTISGIVHYHVDTAKLTYRLFNSLAYAGFVGNGNLQGKKNLVGSSCRLFEVGRIPGDGSYILSLLQ